MISARVTLLLLSTACNRLSTCICHLVVSIDCDQRGSLDSSFRKGGQRFACGFVQGYLAVHLAMQLLSRASGGPWADAGRAARFYLAARGGGGARSCIAPPRALLAHICSDIGPLLQLEVVSGGPQVDDAGRVLVPLLLHRGHSHRTRLQGKGSAGKLETAAAAYPPDMRAGLPNAWWLLLERALRRAAAFTFAGIRGTPPLARVPGGEPAALHSLRQPTLRAQVWANSFRGAHQQVLESFAPI